MNVFKIKPALRVGVLCITLGILLFTSSCGIPQYLQGWRKYIQASISFEKGRYRQAIKAWKQAAEYGYRSDMAYYWIGRSYTEMKEYTKALDAYRETIKQNDTMAEVYQAMGNAYYLMENFAAGVSNYTQAIQLAPKMALYWYNRAYANFSLRNYQAAIDDLDACCGMDPEQKGLHFLRAFCHMKLNHIEKAYADIMQVPLQEQNWNGFYAVRARLNYSLGCYTNIADDLSRAENWGGFCNDWDGLSYRERRCIHIECFSNRVAEIPLEELRDMIAQYFSELDRSGAAGPEMIQELRSATLTTNGYRVYLSAALLGQMLVSNTAPESAYVLADFTSATPHEWFSGLMAQLDPSTDAVIFYAQETCNPKTVKLATQMAWMQGIPCFVTTVRNGCLLFGFGGENMPESPETSDD